MEKIKAQFHKNSFWGGTLQHFMWTPHPTDCSHTHPNYLQAENTHILGTMSYWLQRNVVGNMCWISSSWVQACKQCQKVQWNCFLGLQLPSKPASNIVQNYNFHIVCILWAFSTIFFLKPYHISRLNVLWWQWYFNDYIELIVAFMMREISLNKEQMLKGRIRFCSY